MATLNPLEQKARSSFIKGFVIALLVGLLAAGGIGMLYYQKLEEEQERLSKQKKVLVLSQDVKSGQELEASMFKANVNADGNVVPNGAASTYDTLIRFFESSEEVDIEKVKLIAKTDIYANTIITKDMVSLSSEQPTDDLRIEEYNMIVLPIELKSSDTIDIRLRLPSGRDYIVLSKKRITIPTISGAPSADTIQMKMTEDELLTMSAAIVDAYKIKGSKLYAIKYAEPGMQEKVVATYMPERSTIELINSDPNIVKTARDQLVSNYNTYYQAYRQSIADAIGTTDVETQRSNVESGISTETSTQKSTRQQYLQSME